MGDSEPPSSPTAPAPLMQDEGPTSVRQLGELGLIRIVRHLAGREPVRSVLTGIGDDTAVLALTPGAVLLATTDLLIEGVHFRRVWASPGDIGWKSLAVNLSDIAAMGGVPRFALVSLALPSSAVVSEVEEFFRELCGLATTHCVALVGGDTSSSPDGWMVNVTVLGEHSGRPRRRTEARPGHLVAVTGSLGRAAGGLRLLEERRSAARRAQIDSAVEAELVTAHLRPV